MFIIPELVEVVEVLGLLGAGQSLQMISYSKYVLCTFRLSAYQLISLSSKKNRHLVRPGKLPIFQNSPLHVLSPSSLKPHKQKRWLPPRLRRSGRTYVFDHCYQPHSIFPRSRRPPPLYHHHHHHHILHHASPSYHRFTLTFFFKKRSLPSPIRQNFLTLCCHAPSDASRLKFAPVRPPLKKEEERKEK